MDFHYCTIAARNYLPKTLALYHSIQEQSPHIGLSILLLDDEVPTALRDLPGLTFVDPQTLFGRPQHFHELATIYDVVELSTAVKPLLLQYLLGTYEGVAYLDPDTYLLSPLRELPDLVEEHSVVLTPHFLRPIPPASSYMSEMHCLTVGIYNLGFIAVGRAALPFLQWWWSHLENECLIYPLLGLFVDQKWIDAGTVYFPPHALRHEGYNVGPWNLHERPIRQGLDGVYQSGADALRLFHFSGFDLSRPEELSSRLSESTAQLLVDNDALNGLCRSYAGVLRECVSTLGEGGPYRFGVDSRGNRLSTRVRRAYRADRVREDKTQLPSPFALEEAGAFAAWKRDTQRARAKQLLADAAIAGKYVFPDEFKKLRSAMPKRATAWRASLLRAGRVRR